MENRNESGKKQKAKGLCPNFGKCGGCQYLDVPYEEQLKKKKKQLTELLKPFCQVRDVIGMEDPWHYRNKVHAVIARDRKGRIISGVYKEGTHFVLPVDTCLIEDQKADDIIRTIRELVPSFKMKVYDEDTGYGFLRHVLIRTGHSTGEIMVVLVTASPVFPSKNNFVKALRAAHPEITPVVQNINGRGTSMVLGLSWTSSVASGSGSHPDPSTRSIRSRQKSYTGWPFRLPGSQGRRQSSTLTAASAPSASPLRLRRRR